MNRDYTILNALLREAERGSDWAFAAAWAKLREARRALASPGWIMIAGQPAADKLRTAIAAGDARLEQIGAER